MAVSYITEFVSQGVDLNGRQLPVAALPILRSTTIAIGATSASGSTLLNNTQLIRVNTDTTMSVTVSSGPTATTSGMRMAANQTEYFNIPAGQGWQVAVIANT